MTVVSLDEIVAKKSTQTFTFQWPFWRRQFGKIDVKNVSSGACQPSTKLTVKIDRNVIWVISVCGCSRPAASRLPNSLPVTSRSWRSATHSAPPLNGHYQLYDCLTLAQRLHRLSLIEAHG